MHRLVLEMKKAPVRGPLVDRRERAEVRANFPPRRSISFDFRRSAREKARRGFPAGLCWRGMGHARLRRNPPSEFHLQRESVGFAKALYPPTGAAACGRNSRVSISRIV